MDESLSTGRRRRAVAAGVDRSLLQILHYIWLSGGDPTRPPDPTQHARTLETYAALAADPLPFFPRPEPAALQRRRRLPIPGGTVERISWPSGYQTWDRDFQATYDAYEANRTVWAEWWRHRQPGAPTAVCIHPWASSHGPLQRWMFSALALYKSGFDVVFPVLPFHGRRTPRQAYFSGQLFPGTHPHHTNEAFGQAAWDLRALIRALQANDSGPVGVMGVSLGGYTSALLAGLDDGLAFCIPIIPMVSYGDLLWHHGRGKPHRARAEASGITIEMLRTVYSVHSPLRWAPRLPPDRLMIVAGRGDRVCIPEQATALWEHWDRPSIAWFDGGHFLHFGRYGVLGQVKDFLDQAVGLPVQRVPGATPPPARCEASG